MIQILNDYSIIKFQAGISDTIFLISGDAKLYQFIL